MKLLLLFSLFIYSYGAVTTKEEIRTMLFKTMAEYPTLELGIAQTGCMLSFCRYEDKNGCKQKCNEYVKMRDMKKKGWKTFPANEKECVSRCVVMSTAKAEPLCESLCANHYSYPDRKVYEQTWEDM